jgi:hypothetical protein
MPYRVSSTVRLKLGHLIMIKFWIEVSIFSIIIPAIVGWIRFHRISPAYFPSLFYIWLGTFNELLSFFIVNILYQYNIFNFNLFLLAEALLISWQLSKWGLYSHNKKVLNFIYCFFCVLWLLENFFISGFYLGFNSYFRIITSSIIVFMSIAMLNRILVKEKKMLIKSSIFIICCILIIQSTYALLTELFIVYGVNMNDFFSTNVYRIFNFVNFACNILFTYAIWHMPRRQAFTLQY